jgi:hypothetical protein
VYKIQLVERTIKDYHYWHKYLWDKIIKKIKEGDTLHLKHKAWNSIFDFNIQGNCFGCEWAKVERGNKQKNLCGYCFFDIRNDGKNTCLDGNYNEFCNYRKMKERIKYATIIRDYPLKKEFRNG